MLIIIEGIIKKAESSESEAESEEFVFNKFYSGEDLVGRIKEIEACDLVILDMQMEELDGEETAGVVRDSFPNAVLVFCSGVRMPSVKSFEVNAFRFLLKEYNDEKLTAELKIILGEVKRRKKTLKIKLTYRSEIEVINVSDILYMEKRKHGTKVVIFDKLSKAPKILLSNKNICEIIGEIGERGFAIPHSSFAVNLDGIIAIRNNMIELADGTAIAISRSKEKKFKEEFAFYLSGKY